MTSPPDRSMNATPTENRSPAGGEISPTNLVIAPVEHRSIPKVVGLPERPSPTPEHFGGYGRGK